MNFQLHGINPEHYQIILMNRMCQYVERYFQVSLPAIYATYVACKALVMHLSDPRDEDPDDHLRVFYGIQQGAKKPSTQYLQCLMRELFRGSLAPLLHYVAAELLEGHPVGISDPCS